MFHKRWRYQFLDDFQNRSQETDVLSTFMYTGPPNCTQFGYKKAAEVA